MLNGGFWAYEPLSHEVSLEILKEIDVKEKVKLNYLTRFKRIRNDINYRATGLQFPKQMKLWISGMPAERIS